VHAYQFDVAYACVKSVAGCRLPYDEKTLLCKSPSRRPSSPTAVGTLRPPAKPISASWLGVKPRSTCLDWRIRSASASASAMSFIQYDSARSDVCSPTNHVILSRDFRQQQHGGGMDTIQPYSATERPGTTFSGLKPSTVPFVDRLPYTPMSTTSGFVGPDPTSALPYPFYNFEAMQAAANLSGNIGGGSAPPEVDFRAMTSSNGYSMSSDMSGGLQRYVDCRTSAMTTGPGFLSTDRTPYVNGSTALPVSLNSAVGQQMSPPAATTPTSPTAVVYPWMTIVGQFTFLFLYFGDFSLSIDL